MEPIADSVRYRMQISRSRLFVPDATEVDLDNRVEPYARVKVSREGSYYWRVAAIDRMAMPRIGASVRRFRMLTEPPRLIAGGRPARA